MRKRGGTKGKKAIQSIQSSPLYLETAPQISSTDNHPLIVCMFWVELTQRAGHD